MSDIRIPSAVERLKRAVSGVMSTTTTDNYVVDDEFRERALEEKCGVFGCISNGDWPTSLDVAHIINLGLVGLQHRGQESAGIVTCKYKTEPFNVARSEGLVSQAFSELSMSKLKGNLGVGHTRYSTTGGSTSIPLTQPFVVYTEYGTIAVAHNGELANSSKLRETLLSRGVGLTTGVDSELITQLLSQSPPDELKHPRFRFQTRRASEIDDAAGGNHKQPQPRKVRSDSLSEHCSLSSSSSSSSTSSAAANQTNSGGGGGGSSSGAAATTATAAAAAAAANDAAAAAVKPIWKTDLTAEEDNITSRLLHLMSLTPISYSLVVMYNESLYAIRDSFGNRPLTIGMLMTPPNAGEISSVPFSIVDNCFVEGWVVSSESCPFPSVYAKLKRDVQPGEIIKFERNKLPKTLAIMPRPSFAESPAMCIFEYVYFARPDSIMETQAVYSVRKKCGKQLARESANQFPQNSSPPFIVSPVPESAIPAALGFAEETGLPYVEVFCKNRYVGRTFIQPSTRLRRLGVAKKFGPLVENFKGKNIVLIDDSIVRGTTIGQLVRLLRDAGANEVHIRIASPPLHHPCYMGINIPTREELIASHLNPEQLAVCLGATSLKYLSLDGLKQSVQSGIRDNMNAAKSGLQMPQVGYSSGVSLQNASLAATSIATSPLTLTTTTPTTTTPASAVATQMLATLTDEESIDGIAIMKKVDTQLEQRQHSASTNNQPSPLQQQKATAQEPSKQHKPTTTTNASSDDEWRRKVGHCDACLTRRYPVKLDDEEDAF